MPVTEMSHGEKSQSIQRGKRMSTISRVVVIGIVVLTVMNASAWATDCGTLPPVTPVTLDSVHTFQFTDFGGSDCWGWEGPDGTEYAIMGIAEGVAFVNVTTLQFIQTVPGPLSGCSSIRWRDMVTYDHYCYCVSECSGTNEGLMVIDMQYLPDSVHFVTAYAPSGNQTSHNLTIDTATGFAYAVERSAGGFRIIDLTNPEAPVDLGSVGTGNLHDMFARNDTVWAAEGNQGSFSIWDLSAKSNPQLLTRFEPPSSGYAHNIWPTADGRYAITTEETPNKTIKVWDTQDLGNVQLVGELLGASDLAHNAQVLSDYIVSSHYETGLHVVDISVPDCPREAGVFDTYLPGENASFNGAWGAFPYTTSGKIYVSNDDGRLFILQSNIEGVSFSATPVSGEAPLNVSFVDQTIGAVDAWLW
ncbi:MAG: choice-of-anchor B family protein, partial [candidate division Zixibacteria bacterium]|nr:choice-of-anchor B family protein [candidate division Zixibacteria bacterium]